MPKVTLRAFSARIMSLCLLNNIIKERRIEMTEIIGFNNHNGGYPLWYIKSRHGVYYVLGVLEILLAFRFLFKVLGANAGSGFVTFLYSVTWIFTAPFHSIFAPYSTAGLSAASVFEPGIIIAMAVYWLIAWGIVRLLKIKV
jgi:hypothetical protein